MSQKSFNKSWISQFGLYRYDENLRKSNMDCKICFYGIIGTASVIIITVFVFVTNIDFNPPKRLIILSRESKVDPSSESNQFSTASVYLQQIPTNYRLDGVSSITTPLSINPNETLGFDDAEAQAQKSELQSLLDLPIIHPNHRYDVRRHAQVIEQPLPFNYIIRGTPPTAFNRIHKNSSSSSFPQIPKEYVGTVNSIQDILQQISEKGNNYQDSNVMHKIKIAGTYKHRKVDDLTSMFDPTPRKNREQKIDEATLQSHSINPNNVIGDPFYKYKPNSLSDVNLMATHQFRFAPYPILSNKYVPKTSSHPMDPGNLYHQILIANKNRLKYSDDNSKGENVQSKQKPFTLMLDVYPMPDEGHISSTPSTVLPLKYLNHLNYNMMRHPAMSSINSLQPFSHNANYPQLKVNRYPNFPHYHNQYVFRKFGTKPFNSAFSATNDADGSGNNPSQITVHLNLYPKKKERSDNHSRNVENLNKNDPENDTIKIRLQERMSKLINRTDDPKDLNNNKEPIKITNKVDMDAFQSTTVANVENNIFRIDESLEDSDSTEDLFSKEFLEPQPTDSPTEAPLYFTTLEAKSAASSQLHLIPTILPIEPREYRSFLKTKTVQ